MTPIRHNHAPEGLYSKNAMGLDRPFSPNVGADKTRGNQEQERPQV